MSGKSGEAHLGTPQKLTSLSQKVVWDGVYQPFGAVMPSGQVENPLRLPGQYHDAETGLYQNWYRDYDPAVGRYLQSDPIGLLAGAGTYLYASANPMRSIDPMGLADVYVWYPSTDASGVSSWGHASLSLDDRTTHISWWPKNQYNCKTEKICEGDAFPNQDLAADILFEGRRPDQIIHLSNLNEKAIKMWWSSFRRTSTWKTLTQNCSTTVIDALQAGGAGRRVVGFNPPPVWSPTSVRDYAEAVREAGDGILILTPF